MFVTASLLQNTFLRVMLSQWPDGEPVSSVSWKVSNAFQQSPGVKKKKKSSHCSIAWADVYAKLKNNLYYQKKQNGLLSIVTIVTDEEYYYSQSVAE